MLEHEEGFLKATQSWTARMSFGPVEIDGLDREDFDVEKLNSLVFDKLKQDLPEFAKICVHGIKLFAGKREIKSAKQVLKHGKEMTHMTITPVVPPPLVEEIHEEEEEENKEEEES